jgi:hypothetical protein
MPNQNTRKNVLSVLRTMPKLLGIFADLVLEAKK